MSTRTFPTQEPPSVTEFAHFPKLYEDERLLVYTNGSGEIFVQPKDKRATARIGPDGRGGLVITAHDGTLVPGEVNGLSAIKVRGCRPR